ncbi:MAG: hypothetical protein ACR2N5_08805, partial [Solirubrobacterales bacterium]
MRGVTFRRRLTLLTAGAVVVAIALAAVVTYFLVRDQLRSQVDTTLQERAEEASGLVGEFAFRGGRGLLRELQQPGFQLDFGAPDLGLGELPIPGFGGDPEESGDAIGGESVPPGFEELQQDERQLEPPRDGRRGPRGLFGGPLGGLQVFGQVVTADGEALALDDSLPPLPISEQTSRIAAGQQSAAFSDASVDGEPLRILTIPVAPGLALQLARSLSEVEETMSDLLLILIFVTLGGAALAAVLGYAVSRTALAPVARMTAAAEDV